MTGAPYHRRSATYRAGAAENLAADGWALGVHYARSADAAQTLCADIEKRGGRALPLQADLSDAGQLHGSSRSWLSFRTSLAAY